MTTIGNYKIIKQIGEGGFGKTYEGEHILVNTIRACLKQNINVSDKNSELLGREAEVMSKINHYSLPAFRDLVKASDGSYILIMSFVDGKRLDKIIEKHKGLHPEEVSWITERLLGAIYYLHNKGIIHGDIKPSNIIIQPKEHNAVLIDYGLATLFPTRKSKALGYTEVFVPSEISQGKPPIPESDMYSLGLTMLYALGGDPIAKSYPNYVPAKLQEFYNGFLHLDPTKRSTWNNQDLTSKLSDIRLEVFGRRHLI